jgi:hypothetical protein
MKRLRPGNYHAALIGAAAALVLLPGTTEAVARADTTGTPTSVGAYNCIVTNGGHATRPAGSTITIHQGIGEQTPGILTNFLQAETTLVSANDAQMSDVSTQWGAPVLSRGFWFTSIDVPTGVTLAQPGDQMRFTFALLLSTQVPEIFNPGDGGQPGQPLRNGPGLNFGGTCTVTATG